MTIKVQILFSEQLEHLLLPNKYKQSQKADYQILLKSKKLMEFSFKCPFKSNLQCNFEILSF